MQVLRGKERPESVILCAARPCEQEIRRAELSAEMGIRHMGEDAK